MTILVTGGAGFIGANFVLEWMATVGTPVVNLDKLTYAGDVVAAPAGTDPALVRNGLTCRINLTNPAERCGSNRPGTTTLPR